MGRLQLPTNCSCNKLHFYSAISYKKGLQKTQINGNKSVFFGAVLIDDCPDFLISRGEFTGNEGGSGGANYAEGTSLSLSDCTFRENAAASDGGAIYSSGSLSMSGCTISDNYASFYGGGIFKTGESSSVVLSGTNIICNNTAGKGGADIFNRRGGSISLPSVSTMNQIFHDTRFLIDGWYDDTNQRWSEDGTGNEYLGDTYTITEEKGIIAAYTLYDEIQVTKTWEDENDALGKRPNSLTFTLTDLSGTPVKLRTYDAASKTWIPGSEDAKITLNASDFSGNVWTGTIGPLLLNDYSDPSKYLLKEDLTGIYYKLQPGDPTITYIPDKTGGTADSDSGVFNASFTNHGPVTVSIIKIWDDVNNKDQIRPTALNSQLVIGSTPQADVDGYTVFTLNEDPTTHTWTKTITLPAGDYTNLQATEGRATGYTQTNYNRSVAADGTLIFVFVNQHTLAPAATNTIRNDNMVEIHYQAEKKWEGNNPVGDKKLPQPEVTVILYADGVETAREVIAANADPATATFSNVPKYRDNDGNEPIAYTIKEEITDPGWVKVGDNLWYSLDGMGKYEGRITDVTVADVGKTEKLTTLTGGTATNTYSTLQTTTTVNVTKLWKDHQNENGVRPQYLKLGLFAPGTDEQAATVIINGPMNYDAWTGTFTGLPIYDSTGAVIDYSTYEIREAYPKTLNADGTPASWDEWVKDGGFQDITDDNNNTFRYDYSTIPNP